MGVFMVFLTWVLTVSGFLVIFISLPCIRDKVTEKLCGCVDGEKNEEEDETKEIEIEEESNTNPKQKSIVITIPKGTHEGNNVQVNLPNGKSIDVTVPKGMKAGNTMTINYDDDDAPVKKEDPNFEILVEQESSKESSKESEKKYAVDIEMTAVLSKE